MIGDIDNAIILAARLFLAALFLIFGWRKVRDYAGTVDQMRRDKLPVPALAAVVAIFLELPVAFSVVIGAFTSLCALLMALYTLATSLIEHRYWTVTGAGKTGSLENFYKNLGITGGFLLLIVSGPGRYSIDVSWGIAGL